MISTGIADAKSSIRSTAALAPSMRVEQAVDQRDQARLHRLRWRARVSAPMISLRTRVCSGGSLNTRLVVWCS